MKRRTAGVVMVEFPKHGCDASLLLLYNDLEQIYLDGDAKSLEDNGVELSFRNGNIIDRAWIKRNLFEWLMMFDVSSFRYEYFRNKLRIPEWKVAQLSNLGSLYVITSMNQRYR